MIYDDERFHKNKLISLQGETLEIDRVILYLFIY
jgi:hypothetical protein